MGKFAWVTLATNDSYAMGALVLAHSLKRVNTVHQLVVLITPGVTEAMKTQLSAVFNVVKLVDVLDSRDADNLALLARPELGITFTKLHCWKLTEYEKCVFLDADTLVLQNSDELFEREELSAAPDAGWPDCFNSGVFVYKPSQETFQALIEFALIHGSFDGGDQGLLNLFFSDWATKDIKKHLPFVYNMCSTATYSYLPAFKQYGAGLKIIHFIGAAKPWLQPFNTETGLVSVSGESQHLVQFVQLWWDTFCAHVHPTLSTEMAGLAGALATVTLGAPLTAEQRALEEHLRRQGWEQGNIDYMGKDSFANIWQKICETLGTAAPAAQPAPPEDAPAPVAPVAAPVYVSSVEISPSGQIDKTPPQANYAPVSVLTPTVEASDTKDATKAPLSETATVAPEPKPSVTEVVPTEAIVTPSATLETSAPAPPVASEPPAVQQAAAPVESAVKTEALTPAPKEAPAVAPTPTETQAATPIVAEAPPPAPISTPSAESPPAPIPLGAPVSTPPAPPPTEAPVLTSPAPPVTEAPNATSPAPPPTEAPVPPSPAPPPTEVPVPTPPAPTSAEAPVATSPAPPPTEAPVPTPPALTPTEVPIPTSAPAPSDAPVPTPPAPTSTEAPIPTPPAQTSTEALVPTPPAPTSTETPVSSPAPNETPVPSSTAAPVPTTQTPTSVEAPVPPPPAPTKAPDSIAAVPTPTGTPVSSPAAAAPTPSAPTSTETSPPTPPVSPASVPAPEPAPITAKIPGNVPTPSESIGPAATAELAQPQTPTVTEPTPPTSPPVAAEAPQLTKLQVEADVPETPPVGGSAQPSLEGAVADEPPVPPKRKGGSKAPQDSKNQKGGKPSKGKK